jgi:hypothetical protein
MKITRLALCAAIGLFSMAASAQNAVTVVVPGAPVAAGATGNAIVRLAGTGIAGASFRLCYSTTILTPGTVAIPAGLPGLSCNAPSAGNCPAGTNQGISCAGFAPAGTWALPQDVTVPFTVAANATGTNTPIAFGTPAPNYSDNNGNDITPTATGANFPIAGVVITPPNLTYAPTTAAGVTFPSGVAGAAAATITATPSGGSGSGAAATTTLNTCTASAGFTVTNAPINFTFVGNTTTASTIQLSCTRGAAVQNGTLSCSEQQAANAAVTRTWNLTCPVAVVVSGPALAYVPAPPGPVAFGNVTIPANSVQNIAVTPSGAAGGGTTTLGSCAITGTNAAEFALVSTATLTFTTTAQNLGVRFTPALPVGAKTASLSCTETVQNGATTTRTWNLTGSSVQAPPQFSANPAPPGPVAFGQVVVSQAATRTIVVTNPAAAGAANLPLTGCTLANAPGVLVSPTSLNLAPGASGNLVLTYTPGSATALPANATLTCTDPLVLEATRTWNLTGEGILPAAVPTLGGFGLWAMLGLMLGTGLVVVATRKQ